MYKNLSLVYDKLMDVDYAAYKAFIENLLRNKQNLSLLDLGCGTGTMVDTLNQFGQVTAIDSSEEMLALAYAKNSNANYFCMDMLDIDKLNQKFDFILSAFDVFNYLLLFDDFKKALEVAYACLENQGQLVFDMHTPYKMQYLLNHQPFAYEDDEISYLWFTYETENTDEVESEISFFIKENQHYYKKIQEFQTQRAYPIDVIFETIEKIGFTIADYFCDFDISNKDYHHSQRIIFVLQKN